MFVFPFLYSFMTNDEHHFMFCYSQVCCNFKNKRDIFPDLHKSAITRMSVCLKKGQNVLEQNCNNKIMLTFK